MKTLIKNGFKRVEISDWYKGEDWCKGDWLITKSKGYVDGLVYGYENGARICWMNKEEYKYGYKYVLTNTSDDGVWICKNVYECLRIMRHEDSTWYNNEEE